jgi:hypothetical protein
MKTSVSNRQPTLTREELVTHKVPVYALSSPVRAWVVNSRGEVAEEFTLPPGSQIVNVTRAFCHVWLARHSDQALADVIFPDGRHYSVFYRVTDALKALPEQVQEVQWCTESQIYELVENSG